MKNSLPRMKGLIIVPFLLLLQFLTSCTVITGDSIEADFIEPTPIETPVLEFFNNQIVWEPVENANFYELYLNGVALPSYQTSPYNIDSSAQNGNYSIKALPSKTSKLFLNSPLSPLFNLVYVTPHPLETPVMIFENNKLKWAKVPSAPFYELYKDGLKIGKFSELEYAISADSQNGQYTLLALADPTSRIVTNSEMSLQVNVVFIK